MKLFQRIVLLLKVLVLLSVSASAAWASHPAGYSATGVPGPTVHAIYKSDSEPGDQGQGGPDGGDGGDGGADGGGSGDNGDDGEEGAG